MPQYWYSRWLFERALAAIYVVAFIAAARQFVPLLGTHGLEPVGPWLRAVPFRASPSLFYLWHSDAAFRLAAWIGVVLAVAALTSLPQRNGTASAAVVWGALWLLYLSFVNIGQTFYGFGWETLLCEVGFFAIFAGPSYSTPNIWLVWVWRWTLFRLMFGAGLIKLRGDRCWRDFTCLDYYFETQPMPNALSWYFHWMPHSVHAAGVAINHAVEVAVPFAYFLPQPFASIAGIVTIVFQFALIVSGNLSWLNWLTVVLCIPLISDSWLHWLPVHMPADLSTVPAFQTTMYVVAAVVALLSIGPVMNLMSNRQMMNASFEPLHLVNTYGAFGSVTRDRYEIVLEGTNDGLVDAGTVWKEYEFKGKPGALDRVPPQVAPYHLRLDWLMWFEAMAPSPRSRWFFAFVAKLLQGDDGALGLLRTNPFPDAPPRYLRALYYRYRFTTPAERRASGAWWARQLVGVFYGPVALAEEGTARRLRPGGA
jgi:hypothetical protein